MSQQHNLTITISAPAAAEDLVLLQLEQEEWEPYTGYLTKANLVRQVGRMLYADSGWTPIIHCALVDGQIQSTVYAYPLLKTTKFKVLTSHGQITDGVGEDTVIEETIDFRLDTEQGLKYPATGIYSQEWLTSYDYEGNSDTRPTVTVSGRFVRASAPVYGTLKISYRVYRKVYILTMEPREDALEHFWSAYLMGLPEGGKPVLLEFDTPPTIEELTKAGLDCGGNLNVEVTEEERDPGESIIPGVKIEIYDYCSGRLITTQ